MAYFIQPRCVQVHAVGPLASRAQSLVLVRVVTLFIREMQRVTRRLRTKNDYRYALVILSYAM